MKVSIDKISNYYNTLPNARKMGDKGSSSSITERNFDEIVIHTSARKVEESQFTDQLSRKLMAGLREPASQDKLTALRQQAEQGTYRIDSDAIASRILLQAEDN